MCVRARKTDSSGSRSVETEKLARVTEGGRCRQAEQTVPSTLSARVSVCSTTKRAGEEGVRAFRTVRGKAVVALDAFSTTPPPPPPLPPPPPRR